MAKVSTWVDMLKSAKKAALIQDGRRKIHFTLTDGTELCEEYDVKNNNLLLRKWRKRSQMGATRPWEIEVGEPDLSANMAGLSLGTQHLTENNSNPFCVRLDTPKVFEWRIRNLPYPLKTYQVSVDDDLRTITVRTTNKKYFKKITIPDLDRADIKLSPSDLKFTHANNTLIIQYPKPKQILKDQEMLLCEFKSLKTANEGDMECNQS